MTADSQRVAIAELLEWTEIVTDRYVSPFGVRPGCTLDEELPDYLNDIRYALTFVEFLNKEHSITFEFENELDGEWGIQTSEPHHVVVIGKSLSEAICEAGLKSLSLWVEDGKEGL